MGTLNVTFQGVCTHYHNNVVQGVPHRVVLPDASAFQFGLIDLPIATLQPYYLMPHFAVLRLRSPIDQTPLADQSSLSVRSLLTGGNVFDGIRITVPNASTGQVAYDASFEDVPSLLEFMPEYEFAEEVVTGGRAFCYFDLFGGTIGSITTANGAIRVVASIPTEGAPRLGITLLPFSSQSLEPTELHLSEIDGTVDLLVANQGIDCESEDAFYDFVLHYLTARGGIPRSFNSLLPGMPSNAAELNQNVSAALATLSQMNYPNQFRGACLGPEVPGKPQTDISAACSDSRFP